MRILWGKNAVKPEDALPLNPVNVKKSWKGDLMVVMPGGPYQGAEVKPKGKWVEVYPDHRFDSIRPELWSNSAIKTTVGVLAGFDPELTMTLANMNFERKFTKTDVAGNIAILNGPNLNLLGERESDIYGKLTLKDIFQECKVIAPNSHIYFRQTNSEGEMVQLIHSLRQESDAIIINAGAYTHTSVAIHDALRTYDDQIIELHISNPHQREEFRKTSYISPVAHSYIAGFGTAGYKMAVYAACARL